MAMAIAVGALIASVAPLFAMWMTLKQRTDEGWEVAKDRQIHDLTAQLERCRAQNEEQAQEILRLMRKLLANGDH